jgi:Transposase DDE domain group 1
MGEQHKEPFQLSFNSSLRVDFQGSQVTSDGGLILVRELEERLGMGALIAQHLTDTRRGRNTPFPPADLLRQSVYSRLAGYYEALEERGVKYAICLPTNNSLERDIAELLTRPVGRAVISPWCGTRASSTRRPAGTRPAEWSPRWSPPGRVVPKRRLHRHARGPAESGGCMVLHSAGPGGAVDQGRRTGDALDTAVVSLVPGQ